MTNSYTCRNNKLFLRNDFFVHGKYEIPLVQKQLISLNNIKLLSCSHTKKNENKEYRKYGIHFYVDDYRFNGIYNNPEKTLSKYSQYYFLLTPDFSLYNEMPIWLQIKNVAKNRWCGAYWQKKGLTVFPTLSWSNSQSFDFCFDGIEKNSIISIGMIGCKRNNKLEFLKGYDKMLEKLNPQSIICYGEPFKEMHGNIIHIPFSHSRKEG